MNTAWKTLIEQVAAELAHLKVTATPEEIGRLDWATFDGQSAFSCIYGQMTGKCNSDRAGELYPKVYTDIDDVLNTSKLPPTEFGAPYFTPLEVFLYEYENSPVVGQIFDFLTDKTESLDFLMEWAERMSND